MLRNSKSKQYDNSITRADRCSRLNILFWYVSPSTKGSGIREMIHSGFQEFVLGFSSERNLHCPKVTSTHSDFLDRRFTIHLERLCSQCIFRWTFIINARLYVELVLDKLNEVNYDAAVADLTYSLSHGAEGLCISISGYNDKLHILLSNIVHEMKHLEVVTERFEVAKERTLRGLKNWKLEDPMAHASYFCDYLLSSSWSMDELQEAVTGMFMLREWKMICRSDRWGGSDFYSWIVEQLSYWSYGPWKCHGEGGIAVRWRHSQHFEVQTDELERHRDLSTKIIATQ